MCHQAGRKYNAIMHFKTMNKYLQQEGNLQINSIPQWYSASLSVYDIKEINNPVYWLENTDGSYIQDSCYYFQFTSHSEAKKIYSCIKGKDKSDFMVIDAGIFYVAKVNNQILDVLDLVKTYFVK